MTESFSSEETAPSKPPKDILGLGMHLVHELGLRDSTDTMGRWLAHHLAELMSEAKNGKKSTAHRVEARKQAADLILKIWERRASLPGNAYPLAQYKDVLQVVNLLRPDANPWQRRSGTPYQILAATIHDRLCRIVIGLLLVDVAPLLRRRSRKRNKSVKFLLGEEREILEELERWRKAVSAGESPAANKSESQKIDVRLRLENLADEAIKHLRDLQQRLAQDPAASSVTEKISKKRNRKSRDARSANQGLRVQKRKRKERPKSTRNQ